MATITRKVSDGTAHNVSSAVGYTAANYPTLFTGKSNKDGVVFAVDPSLMDDSQNASSPMTISKESVHTLMPASWKGRIGMHGQFWWGNASHPNIGFSNTNDADMTNIFTDIAARGYDVVIPDWYGATATGAANDAVVDIIAAKCLLVGIRFMVMIDQQYWGQMGYTTATYTQGIIDAITHLNTRYFGHGAYEKYTFNGVARPMLLLWNIAAVGGTNLDWTAIRNAAVANGNPLLIQYQASGFNVAQSDGSLSWVDTQADNSSGIASGVTYLRNSFLPAVKNNPTKISLSSVWKGFNGTMTRNTAWSLGKFIDQQWGQTWLDTWAENASFVNAGNKLDYVCTVVLDDYEEGTEVQSGIRTNVAVNAGPMSGTVIPFSVTGNENTVRQYNLWGTVDGITETLLASVKPGAAKQFDTATITAPSAGTYTLRIEAQGMPSLQNHMAAQTFQAALAAAGATGGTTSTSVPQPPANSGIDYQANLNAASAWLAGQQLADGAIIYTSTVINPYFGNYAAMGWLRDITRYAAVQAYLQWYVNHLNATDYWGINTGGTIYDYSVAAGATGAAVNESGTTHAHADSVDSYCATFLSLCWAAWQTTDAGLRAWITAHKASLDKVAATLTNVKMMDVDGLTWAKPDYQNKYTMDNSEVYAGFRDYASLCNALGDATGNGAYAAAATKSKTAVLGLWTGSSFLVNKGGAAIDMTVFYPDSLAQLFPVLCGLLPWNDATATTAYNAFNTANPTWPTLGYMPGKSDFPQVLMGEAALNMKDFARVNTFIQSIMAKYQNVTPPFPWTWYGMENGMYMLINSDMLRLLSAPAQPAGVSGGVNPNAPAAALTATPAAGPVPLQVAFDASQSLAITGRTIANYQFNFGDGSAVTSINPAVTHSYIKAGTFLASVVVTDNTGAKGVATFTVAPGGVQVVTKPGSSALPPPANTAGLAVTPDPRRVLCQRFRDRHKK